VAYKFDSQIVADPVSFQRAPNASVAVYDADDASNTTLLALTDLNGLPLPNPLTSSADAFLPPFKTTSAQVKLVGANLTALLGTSFDALLDEAQAASDSAAAAAASAASAASYAAGLLGGTLDGGNASSTFTSSYNFDGGNANG
jgi:hypothetical protein